MSRHVSAQPPPPLLAPDARIAVIAPAGAVDQADTEQGIALLERWGYRAVRGEHLYRRHRYNAGSLAERSADLNWALSAPDLDAVWLARGGYGCVHCLPALPAMLPRDRPLIGLSDATSLLSALHRRGHTQLLHGPMVEGLVTRMDDTSRDAVHRWLEAGAATPLPVEPLCGQPGPVSGPLVGGNLTVLASIAGTPWSLRAEGAIVLLEDVGETAYRLDRSLTQLIASGGLAGARAIVLGEFVRCPVPEHGGFRLEEVLRDLLLPLGLPVFHHAPFGHGSRNIAWRYGSIATLADGRLAF